MRQAYGLAHPPRSVTYVLNLLCYPCSEPAPLVADMRGLHPSLQLSPRTAGREGTESRVMRMVQVWRRAASWDNSRSGHDRRPVISNFKKGQ